MNISATQLPKARAFWARKEELRRHPGRCSRCGKGNANGHRQCDKCREYGARYRARKRAQKRGVMVDEQALRALERRIGALEHYMARLRTFGRIEYNRGYCAGRRLHRAALERASYFDAIPPVSPQERATFCALDTRARGA